MKKFVCIFITFVVSFQIFAQQEVNTQFRNQTLQVYQNLDKNRVPHGILLDFGMEFTNLRAFNGVLADSTLTTSQTLSDTYKTLLMCRVRNVNNGFITPEEYSNRWYSQREEGVITLSGQYFKYSNFADNAYPTKINYNNNRFSDRFVNGIWQNPYEEQSMFVMAPSISKYSGLNLKVKLPQNLMLSNYANTIQQIHIDFGDGIGFRAINYNTLINVNYNRPNTYTWKYRITLTNGQIIQSHSKVIIERGLNAIDYDVYKHQITNATQNQTLSNPLNQLYKKKITATVPVFGRLGTATVYVRFANGNNITKPLIVAEGFDPGIILSREIEGGENNIFDFFINFNSSQSNLMYELESYDIIYVDWDNGVDFLQRNAMVLEEVIRWVNEEKIGNQKNVVLGQSMGGLIARYALRDIELNRDFNHDTRLYISHDAPHLGANVPYSVQYSARHLRNLYVQTPVALLGGEVLLPMILNYADGYIAMFNSVWGTDIPEFDYGITPLQGFSLADVPAARQMQYLWVTNQYAINNTIFEIWQQEYHNLGFPQGYTNNPIRNISIANGSECGALQQDNGNIMSYIKDAGKDTFLSNYIGILDAVYGSMIANPLVVATALFPGKSYWEIDFQSRYMTNLNQNKQIYKGSIKYKKKVFWFVPVSITITNRSDNQPSGVLPYDVYGGGYYKTSTNSIPVAGSTLISNEYSFIPTASALAIGNGTITINDGDYKRSYVGAFPPEAPKNTQFHNYVTHFDRFNPNNSNSEHISFNHRNGNWLRSELNVNIQEEITDCTYMCASNQILGSEILCSSETYNIPAGGIFYNWSIIQGANLVNLTGNGTPNITLTSLPNVSGQITISLVTGDDPSNEDLGKCGNITFTKTVWVGKPIVTLPADCWTSQNPSTPNCFSLCRQTQLSLENSVFVETQGVDHLSLNNNNNWEWQPITNNFNIYPQGNSAYIATYFNPQPQHYVSYRVRVQNACGWSDWFEHTLNLIDCGGDTGIGGLRESNTYKVYPNPSNDIVNIELRDQNNKPEKDAKISGELFDLMGQSKSKVNITNNMAIFSVRGLNKGIYVLNIHINDQIESHQIAVE